MPSSFTVTDAELESGAGPAMRDAVISLSTREGIPYEEALLRFTSSRVYNALFDYNTEIWKESSDYLLSLYDFCNSKKSA